MKKNVASQAIGAQMCSATDGSAFTSAVTVYVTGDAGTQAIGSVGSGACTHEGNGYHTYAPAQAETNYDLVAFTFIGTGAVPATIQVATAFPQTGDNYARLGAPAGASVSADIAAAKVDTAAIKVKTDYLPSVVAGGAGGVFIAGTNAATTVTTSFTTTFTGSLTGSVASVTGAVGSVTARVTANADQLAGQTITAAAGVTFPTSVASPTNITAGTITTVTNLTNAPTAGDLTATMKTSVTTAATAATPTAAAVTAGVTVTTNNDKTGYALSTAGVQALWDALTSALTTVGSIGKAIVTNLDAAVSSRLASASYTAPDNTTITAIAGYVDTEVAAIKAKTDLIPAAPAAVGDIPTAAAITTAVWTTALTEAYATDGSTFTGAQAFYQLWASTSEFAIAGTTITAKKLDGSTTAMTFTLDDGTNPTSRTRAT